MLKLLKSELDKYEVFTSEFPEIAEYLTNSIYNNTITNRMKLTIAVSELIQFMSQFRRNIKHWNGSYIPINAITFSIASSGAGKDSSVNAVRKCFKKGYDVIERKRNDIAIKQAIQKAQQEGLENPSDFTTYKKFYNPPNPLFVSPSTTEGFIQHLNDLDTSGIGAGYIKSGEFGAELANNSLLVDNIVLLAELYDEGSKEVKVLKVRENQSKEIKNLPVSAMFLGSQDNILYDTITKHLFKREFSTKLARRSFFNFNKEVIKPPEYSTIEEMFMAETEAENMAVQARTELENYFEELAHYQLNNLGRPITISEETRILLTVYKRYNEELHSHIEPRFPIARIVRLHMHWKALKLAGAFCLADNEDSIQIEHYVYAIRFCELLDKDMQNFELELVKEPYEVFVDYMQSQAVNYHSEISLHLLRKLGYIATSGVPKSKMEDLVQLATSYDKSGIYTVHEESIHYDAINFSNISGVSYLAVSGSKEQRAKQSAEGYEFYEVTFAELGELLAGDYAYCSFKFKDGKRAKANIESGTKWICLDIDNSTITDEEAHFIFQDINHHIARTSNEDNPFKFRILFELDAIIDIPDTQWKHFIESICNYLSIKADILPKSQIYFSYAGRSILSVTDQNPIEVKDHLLYASSSAERKESQPKKLTTAQKQAQINDPLTTFQYAFEAASGEGSRSLIRAAYHAIDLGMTMDNVIQLMHEINNYWDEPMDDRRFQNTIITQVERMF